MKQFITLIFALSFFQVASAQLNSSYLKVRADSNLRYLLKGNHRTKPVELLADRISISTPMDHYKPVFSVYWSEVPTFIEIMETKNSFEVLDMVKGKGNGPFYVSEAPKNYTHYSGYPVDFKDLYVAIDPGHFGGSQDEAMYERRFIKVEGKELGQKSNGFFYEAELTYATALLIKEKLEALGAHVLITRPNGAGAKEKSFKKWIKEDFKTDLEQQWKSNQISSKLYNDLKEIKNVDSISDKHKYTIFEFYKFLDFRARIDKINDFNPNITIVLHFNATEGSKTYGTERFIKPSKNNYSMAFIPGAFLPGELNRPEDVLDFTRLTLSPDFDNSERLASLILQQHEASIGVKPISYDSLKGLQKNVNQTKFAGVYARNLPMTRMVRGPVVYLESFCQDNIDMMKQLVRKDFTVNDPGKGVIKTSKLCDQTSKDIVEGMRLWLEENKEEVSKLSANANKN